jgi:hypothetical protein
MKVKGEPGAFSCGFNSGGENKMKVKVNKTGVELFFGEFFPVWVWLYEGRAAVSLNRLAPYKARDYYNLLWETIGEKEKGGKQDEIK